MKYFIGYLVRISESSMELLMKYWFALFGLKPKWLTDYDAALAEASDSSKIVLADFTGSDWCSPCINLKKEVFDALDFEYWAYGKAVLLEIDFPTKKPQPPELVQQNAMLAKKYGVSAYPTVIGLNPDGTERGRLAGYTKGTGPKTWIAQFEAAVKLNQSAP